MIEVSNNNSKKESDDIKNIPDSLSNKWYILINSCVYRIDKLKTFNTLENGNISFKFDGVIISNNSFNNTEVKDKAYSGDYNKMIVAEDYETLKLYLETDNESNNLSLFDQVDFYENKYNGKFRGLAINESFDILGYIFEKKNLSYVFVVNPHLRFEKIDGLKNVVSISYEKFDNPKFEAFRDMLETLDNLICCKSFDSKYSDEIKIVYSNRDIGYVYF